MKTLKAYLVLAALAASVVGARADVIPGPTLNSNGGGWTTTGLEFTALANTNLTSFVYQNQGQADTVVLTDTSGNVLQSLNTPGGNTSYTANVNWGLTAGQSYWLLQTVASNELFAGYGLPLPSNTTLQIDQSGTFDYSIPAAVANSQGWGSNEYWAAFNNITTAAAPGPVPGAGLAGLAALALAGLYGRTRRA
jgi:hypothetical protein